ncbi:MAG TPA: sulfatase-like hydrolase/transferase [Pirellulaceae bacterium]|nr:sulfatase-like hydrolase/transferase [Pirellulaceae bacterium]
MYWLSAKGTFVVNKQKPNHSTKLKRLAELLDELSDEEDRKVIVFSERTTMLGLIEPLLEEHNMRCVQLDGSVPQAKRQLLVPEFQTNPQCRLIVMTNARSTGLNLQSAHSVINVDLPRNPAVLEQQMARAHHMGQNQNTQVFNLITEQTLEESLSITLADKRIWELAAINTETDVDTLACNLGRWGLPINCAASLLIASVICIILQFYGVVCAQSPAEPLNVVVLVADDQRWDSLGAAGNAVIHTPHLDQLAQDGIQFNRCYVTTSICMTSRASILTGQYMSRHGIDQFGKSLTPEQFAETYTGALRADGYFSGFVGKYGVGAPPDGGFDFVRIYGGQHWVERGGTQVHVTEQNARDAIEFLESRPSDRPFVLSVSFFAPHAEDGAPQQYLPQPWSAPHYDGKQVPVSELMNSEYLDALPEFLRAARNEGRIRFHWRFDTPARFQESMINYYRLITEIDDAVGRIVAVLQQQGVLERTLIIYTGDNGYFHAERGLADKWYPYDESIRVPLLIHDPRLFSERRGLQIDSLALNIDLAPTILEAAHVNLPQGVQGRDLGPLYLNSDASGELPPWREEFFYEHPTITNRERIPASQAVVRRDVKYIYWPEWEYEQLFDLTEDPTEKQDIAHDPDNRDRLLHFRNRLRLWRDDVK